MPFMICPTGCILLHFMGELLHWPEYRFFRILFFAPCVLISLISFSVWVGISLISYLQIIHIDAMMLQASHGQYNFRSKVPLRNEANYDSEVMVLPKDLEQRLEAGWKPIPIEGPVKIIIDDFVKQCTRELCSSGYLRILLVWGRGSRRIIVFSGSQPSRCKIQVLIESLA